MLDRQGVPPIFIARKQVYDDIKYNHSFWSDYEPERWAVAAFYRTVIVIEWLPNRIDDLGDFVPQGSPLYMFLVQYTHHNSSDRMIEIKQERVMYER